MIGISQLKKNLAHKPGATSNSHAGGPGDSHGAAESEKTFVPVFMPMGRAPGADMIICRGKSVPTHVADIVTRGDMLNDNLDASMRSGNFAAIYKAYVLAVFFALATLVTAFFNVWVAAGCAYLAGHFYSERMLNAAWGIAWYKGKSMTYTL